MHYQTTRITVTFNGSPTAVHYWVDGNGHHFPGYATSLRQLRKQLYVAFGVPDLDLYCITNKRMHALTSDSQMRRAIHASGGDTLLLTAYEPNDEDYTSEQSLPNAEERPTANPSSKTILSHFGGHNYECQYCKRTQISGVRYKYVGTTSVYSVCDACYSRLDSRKKLKCHARVMPWKTDAPAAPLRPKDLASINHLQYLLVKLGYLHISCSTSISKTEEAVASFRQQYHIYSNDMTEYDSKTARKLTLVVRQSRADGHKYI